MTTPPPLRSLAPRQWLTIVTTLTLLGLPACKDDLPESKADAAATADVGELDGALSDVASEDTSGLDTAASDTQPADTDATTNSDTESDTSTAADTLQSGDASTCIGRHGCPCSTNDDCDSGVCLDTHEGKRCAQPCVEECPNGYACKKAPGQDVKFVCVSKTVALCAPCQADADCQPAGQDALCLDYGEAGRFCGAPCEADADCPSGYGCQTDQGVGAKGKQCRLKSGACACSAWASSQSATTACAVKNAHGTCSGTRTCAVSGLSPCSAETPAAEVCNTIDDDCDGKQDNLPADATCSVKAFKPEGTGTVCATDPDCKVAGEACNKGKCQVLIGSCPGTPSCSSGGKPVCLEAKTPTLESCNLADDDCDGQTDEDTCDDGDACTVDVCDTGTGKCSHKPAKPCDDGEPCTADACDKGTGECAYTPKAGPCDDGDACTEGDACAKGTCSAGKAKVCDDGEVCTKDTCDPKSGCAATPLAKGATCTDGDICTEGDTCEAGLCKGNAKDCDDKDACTKDSCDPKSGCVHKALSGTPCDDGEPCTGNDTCTDGKCVPYGPNCACLQDADCASKEDGNLCNGTLFCDKTSVPYHCKVDAKTIVACDSSKDTTCAKAACDPKTGKCGLKPVSDGTKCDDGSVCTTVDACAKGTCAGSKPPVCDDKNPCTDDSCDKATGCVTTPNTNPCDDGDKCTTVDVCSSGKCTGAKPPVCDDKNPCTDDSCDKAKGCVKTPNTKPCDDGDKCTTVDVCSNGKCTGAKPPACDDKNLCTDDSCDKAKGCVTTPNTKPCDDGDKCTTVDVCSNGKCTGAKPPVCDDKNPCTDDSCDQAKGCVNAPNTANCSDGSACTVDDACKAGKCAPGSNKNCDDGNTCTDDACDPKSGCKSTAVKDGAACASGMVCAKGTCVAPAVDYDHDGLVGSADACPTVWSPMNGAVCPDAATWKLPNTRKVEVGQPDGKGGLGASTWRRSNEPFEIPLTNGILDDSVVGRWAMRGDLFDHAGKAGSSIGALKWTASVFGDQTGAAQLDGKSVGLRLHAGRDYRLTGDFTVGVWLKLDTYSGQKTEHVASTASGDVCHDGGFQLVREANKVSFVVTLADGSQPSVSMAAPPTGKWHHVAAVRAESQLRLFLNGHQVVVKTVKGGVNKDCGNWLGVGFERHFNQKVLGRFLAGAVGELLLVSRAMSPAELAVYAASKAAYGSTYVPGAQADFDDVRVSETTPWQKAHGIHQERLGAMPHSDTDLKDVAAYWRLDGDGKDVVGKHHATVHSAAGTRGRFGRAHGALEMNGLGYVKTPFVPIIQPKDAFTLELWAKTDSKGLSRLIGFSSGGNHELLINVDADKGTTTALLRGAGGSSESRVTYGRALADGQWHHYGLTRAPGAQVALYIDGVKVAAVSDKTKVAVNDVPKQPLLIGDIGDKGTPQGSFHGAVDEVLFHTVARTADYFAKRARGLPRMRVLVHTAVEKTWTGAFLYHQYMLHWGSQTMPSLPTVVHSLDKSETCEGLLSLCVGYAGWWRFDDPDQIGLDSSAHRHHGVPGSTSALVPGASLLGLAASGTDGAVRVPSAKHLNLAKGTWQVAARPATCKHQSVLLDMNKSGLKGGEGIVWLEKDCRTVFFQDDQVKLYSKTKATPGSWSSWSVRFGGKGFDLLGGDGVEASKLLSGATIDAKLPLTIGSDPTSANYAFDGALDDVRLMNRPLEADELLHFPLSSWAMPCKGSACTAPAVQPGGDLDHDGLAGAADPCPTVWNPDADTVRGASSCAPWSGGASNKSVKLQVSEPGREPSYASQRRTLEPIDVPLANGVLNASVLALFRFEGDVAPAFAGEGKTKKTGSPQWVNDGLAGKALRLDGKDDVVELWKDRTIRLGSNYTLAGWVRLPKGTSAGAPVIVLGTGDKCHDNSGQGSGPDLAVTAGRVPRFGVSWNGKSQGPTAPAGLPDDGDWHHIAGVRRGRTLALFVDGRVAATHEPTSIPQDNDCGNSISLGAVWHHIDKKYYQHFAYDIDEIMVIGRALTPAEIEAYVHSRATLGTTRVPGAQKDHDDVRVTEQAAWEKAPHLIHQQLVGASPHSDTKLDGVVAYWPLDVVGSAQGAELVNGNKLDASSTPGSLGRFGDKDGAMRTTKNTEGARAATLSYELKQGSWEAWVRPTACQKDVGRIFISTRGKEKKTGEASLAIRPGCDGFSFAVRTGNTTHLDLKSKAPVPTSRWSHIAATWDGKVARLFVDGVKRAEQSLSNAVVTGDQGMYVGRDHDPAHFPLAELDDVLVHSVARPASYFYQRANGLPSLRFLASTAAHPADKGVPFHDYVLRWGDAKAKAPATHLIHRDGKQSCFDLLSPCLGYRGWWPMDDLVDAAPDLSSRSQFVGLANGQWVPGAERPGYRFAGTGVMAIASDTINTNKDFTLEALVRGTASSAGVLSMMKNGNGLFWWDFGKGISLVLSTANVQADVGDKLLAGTWGHFAMALDAGGKALHGWLDGEGKIFKPLANGAPTHPGVPLSVGQAKSSPFKGALSGLRVMDRRLHADELLHYPRARASWK